MTNLKSKESMEKEQMSTPLPATRVKNHDFPNILDNLRINDIGGARYYGYFPDKDKAPN